MKIYGHDAGHMTKIAATKPIYAKTPSKNLLLRNQWTDFNETWYVASGTPVHYNLFKDDPGLTLTYFTARSNFET